MRQANIYYQETCAGLLVETDDGEYTFAYEADYIEQYPHQFLSFTMPVSQQTFKSLHLIFSK